MLDPAFPILHRLTSDLGIQAWAVGGYVRDHILGRSHSELDVVVENGRGFELAEAFATATGSRRPVLFERFGTAQVTWGDRLIEFASARAESYAPDSRKPEVRTATLEEDLRRRDFTINALLMDFEGNVHDRLGRGLPDLKARLLRTPLDPVQTFSDDPLRMLRAIRFAAQLERDGIAAMAGFATEELVGLFGSAIRHRLTPLAASFWRADQFARGSYSYALPGHADDRARLAAPVDNRLFFAGEACSPHFFSTAHGAYETGIAAAEAALASLAR